MYILRSTRMRQLPSSVGRPGSQRVRNKPPTSYKLSDPTRICHPQLASLSGRRRSPKVAGCRPPSALQSGRHWSPEVASRRPPLFFVGRLKIWPTPVSRIGKSPISRLDRPSRVGELSASYARLLPTQVCMVGWIRAHARWSLSCEKIGKDASVQAH
jgi:hypothetical protein